MSRRVVLVPYDPAWPDWFEREAAELRDVLGDIALDVHHIGSTSVPGLTAKPVMDMIPVIESLAAIDARRPQIEAAGYAWRGELGIARRRYLTRGHEGPQDLHAHCFAAGDPQIARHLLFRDVLRTDECVTAEYVALKLALRDRFPNHGYAYADAKDEFVARVLRNAGWVAPGGTEP